MGGLESTPLMKDKIKWGEEDTIGQDSPLSLKS
jgi:hypothetical protein